MRGFMVNIRKISIENIIQLQEKKIKLLNKIYKKLKTDLENKISKKEIEYWKYYLLITLYTLSKEIQKKNQYKELYSKNNKSVVIIDLSKNVKYDLESKLNILNIYLNNSKEIEKVIKYGNEEYLMKVYNFRKSDIELLKYIITNYKYMHKEEISKKR